MRRILMSRGHKVSEASSGLDFIRQLEATGCLDVAAGNTCQHTYDAILIDDSMPEMRGPEAVKIVRGRGYDGLIIGITGNTGKEEIDYFIAQGANTVLQKPLNSKELEGFVAMAIRGKDTSRPSVISTLELDGDDV
jgi:CheY-like chemotaxis protein